MEMIEMYNRLNEFNKESNFLVVMDFKRLKAVILWVLVLSKFPIV